MNIPDSRVLITGGAGGIGQFLSEGLLAGGATVFAVDQNQEALDAVPSHERLHKLACDITQPEQVAELVNRVFQMGGANVLLNNAGIIHSEPLINLLSRPDRKHSVSNWSRVIDVNLNGVFYMTANFVDKLISGKQRGLIINVSSIAANGNIGQSAYSASKAAVEALTKTWSKELGMFKIRCTCIAPGFIDTPSTRASLSEHVLTKWEKSVPLGRLGQLNEILSAVEFMITNEYYNGKVLQLDGGLNL